MKIPDNFNKLGTYTKTSPVENVYKFICPVERITEEQCAAQGISIIKTVDEWNALRNDSTTPRALFADLDLNGEACNIPMLNSNIYGNGHTIKNSSVIRDHQYGKNIGGLIDKVDSKTAVIRDLILENFTVQANIKDTSNEITIGILAGTTSGSSPTITNCGVINSRISGHCGILGGLVGYIFQSAIQNSYVMNTTIEKNGYFTTNVSSKFGGLLGQSLGYSVKNCFTKDISMKFLGLDTSNQYCGGLIADISGMATSTVEQCFASNVTFTELGDRGPASGGMFGRCYLEKVGTRFVTDCYADNIIFPSQENESYPGYWGGFAGLMDTYRSNSTWYFKYNYLNRISLQNLSANKGIFFGKMDLWDSSQVYSNSYYWDNNLTIPAVCTQSPSGVSSKLTKLETADFKSQSSYTGFNFENIWGIDAAVNEGYPYLLNTQLKYN